MEKKLVNYLRDDNELTAKRNNPKYRRKQTIGEPYPPMHENAEHSKANDMLIKDVVEPLLSIIYLYKDSSGYTYEPDTNKDTDKGWKYFERRFTEIYKALNKNLYISHNVYCKIYRIIEGVHSFARQYSRADGLPEIFFEANPNLRFYRSVFDIKESNPDLYEKFLKKSAFPYIPTNHDLIMHDIYFEEKRKYSEKLNLHYDDDDLFIQELANTVRIMFINILAEHTEI